MVEIGPRFSRSTLEARRSSFLKDSFSVIAVTTRVGPMAPSICDCGTSTTLA